jgi:predicted ribosomally synthesized peptide with SipW-like signal peptide
MKNVVLSIVVIATLVAAGIGGTLADFSDYEVSEDNYFEVGGMDLTVSDSLGNEYNGANIPTFWQVTDGWPECSKDRNFDLHNQGSNEQETPTVYMHWKNLEQSFLPPKVVYDYVLFIDDDDDGIPDRVVDADENTVGAIAVCEPDYVAILGGVAGEDANGATVIVPGIGVAAYGLLAENIVVNAQIAGPYTAANKPAKASLVPAGDWRLLDLSAADDDSDGVIHLSEMICDQLAVIDLPGCNSVWIKMSLVMVDMNENEFGLNEFEAGSKFENWPTNALMYDKCQWDIGFEMIGVGGT